MRQEVKQDPAPGFRAAGIVDRYSLPREARPHLVGPLSNDHSSPLGKHGKWLASEMTTRPWRQATSNGVAIREYGLLVWFSSVDAHDEIERRLHVGLLPTAFARHRVPSGNGSEARTVITLVPRGADPQPQSRASRRWAAQLE